MATAVTYANDESRQAPDVPTLWSGFWEPGMPDLLLDMRVVQEWPLAINPIPVDEVRLNGLRQMYANDYLKFRDRLDKLEVEWMQLKRAKLESTSVKSPSEWSGKGACPTCKRGPVVGDASTGECVGKVEKWLGEQEG